MRHLPILLAALILFGAGNLRAQGVREGTFELGPYVGYSFPDQYGGAEPKNNLLYGLRFGYFVAPHVSFEPSYQMIFTDTKLAAPPQENVRFSSLRFNLLYNFLTEQRIQPFVTGGVGWEKTDAGALFDSNDLGVNAGAGVRFVITDYLAARLDGRFVYAEIDGLGDLRQYNYEGALGISFLFGGQPATDTDADGVKDKKDECPNTPAGATVDAKGCPSDADGDAVHDGIDKCPDTIKGATVDAAGCPADADKDGVFDGPDQCADTPEGTAVDEKGCPKDQDGDGVLNETDQCPDTPKDTKVDEKGCPADTDGDTVTDDKDLCPDTAKGTEIDEKGCPKVTKSRGVLKGINFKFGKAELTPESTKILDEVAAELTAWPKVRAEVQGHTDNTGPVDVNLRMSNARAKSVMDYLVSKGVDASRLEAKGYGMSKPIGNNKTKAGRAQNRRVELNWID